MDIETGTTYEMEELEYAPVWEWEWAEEPELEAESGAGACAESVCGRPPYPPVLAKGHFSWANRYGHRWYAPQIGDNLSKLAWLVMRKFLITNGVFHRDPTPSEVQDLMNTIRDCACNKHLKGKMFLPRFKEDRYTPGGRYYGAIHIPLKFEI